MKAAFCGSFDPITLGHLDLIERASHLYEDVYVFVACNSSKTGHFDDEQKREWIEKSVEPLKNVHVMLWNGLAVDACHAVEAGVLLRGIRNETDMAYEANMAYMNACIAPDLETVCLFCRPEYAFISSSNVRELLRYGQSIKDLVPACVAESLQPEGRQKEN